MLTSNVVTNLVFLTCLVFPALVSGCCHQDQCTCEPNCWEKCFLEPKDIPCRNPYKEIYAMAVGIRNLYLPCSKPHGTAYMLDSDVPSVGGISASQLFLYQRQLAAIVAMVQPVGNDCNPFCASKFFRNFGFYVHNWPCKNRCEAMRFFNNGAPSSISSFASTPGVQSSWVGGGEILSRLCFDRPNLAGHECMNCTNNELLIAFTNSPTFGGSVCDAGRFSCVAVGVHPASLVVDDAWAKTGNAYHLPSTDTYLRAADMISSCLQKSCCSNGLPFPSSRQSEPETFGYITPADNEQERSFRGTFADFEEKILNPITQDDGVSTVGNGGPVKPSLEFAPVKPVRLG